MLNIIDGRQDLPLKAVFYGPEGIGKSTLASKAPEPLFIDTENGTGRLNVRRIPKPDTWEELLAVIEEISRTPDLCQTLILDTADWAEMMCIRDICAKYKVNGLESFGYGKGYTYVAEEMVRLLSVCDKVVNAGKNMIIIAHAKMRKQELPDEQGAFDRWELKVSKQSAPLLKEWPDLLLFLTYKTLVVTTENNAKKATGGKRVMKTSHSPVWDAKNRFNLPEEMDMDFSGIAGLFKTRDIESETFCDQPIEELYKLIGEAQVTEEDVRKVVSDRRHYSLDTPITEYPSNFISGWIIKYWPQILELINDSKMNKEGSNNE